jgi:hypothetical protein
MTHDAAIDPESLTHEISKPIDPAPRLLQAAAGVLF